MIRKIIHIDATKCTGCGLCVDACHEGAIVIRDGKAVLVRDDYCDGLGACLPACPEDALSFEEREALPFDQNAVDAHLAQSKKPAPEACPGLQAGPFLKNLPKEWPVQLQLIPTQSPRFDKAHLVLTADCAAYACPGFHQQFLQHGTCVIACPKLDPVDYRFKLQELFEQNDLQSITVVRMSVPCCAGLAQAAHQALQQSGKTIPFTIVQIAPDGSTVEENKC